MLGRHTSTLDFCDQVPTGAYALNESHSVMAAPGFQGLTWKEVPARLKRFPRVVQQVGFAMHRGTVSCLVRVLRKNISWELLMTSTSTSTSFLFCSPVSSKRLRRSPASTISTSARRRYAGCQAGREKADSREPTTTTPLRREVVHVFRSL